MKIFVAIVALSLCAVVLCEEEDQDSHEGHAHHTLRDDGHTMDDGHGHTEEELDGVHEEHKHDNHHEGTITVTCMLTSTKKGANPNGAKIQIKQTEPKELVNTFDFTTVPLNTMVRALHSHLDEEHKFEITTTMITLFKNKKIPVGRHTVIVKPTKVEDGDHDDEEEEEEHEEHDHDDYVFSVNITTHVPDSKIKSPRFILVESEETKLSTGNQTAVFKIRTPKDKWFKTTIVQAATGFINLNCKVIDDYEDHDSHDGQDHTGHNH